MFSVFVVKLDLNFYWDIVEHCIMKMFWLHATLCDTVCRQDSLKMNAWKGCWRSWNSAMLACSSSCIMHWRLLDNLR